MRLLRIYSSPDGESHFDEIEVPQPPAVIFSGEGPLHVSSKYRTTGTQFITVPAGIGEVDRHNPPERLFGIVLSGFMEIETSDGAVYRLNPGRVVLVDDTLGKGHIARCPHGVTVAFIAAPAETSFDVSGRARRRKRTALKKGLSARDAPFRELAEAAHWLERPTSLSALV
jgi:hypothetical protein